MMQMSWHCRYALLGKSSKFVGQNMSIYSLVHFSGGYSDSIAKVSYLSYVYTDPSSLSGADEGV